MERVKRQNILLIDNEIHIMELMRYNLENNGYRVEMTQFRDEANKAVEEMDYDLLLMNSEFMDFLQDIEDRPKCPILIITDKEKTADLNDELEGIERIDYIVKPFTFQEIHVRIKFLLAHSGNRQHGEQEDILKIWDLVINRTCFTVKQQNQEIFLTYKEFELLYYLVQNAGQVCMREKILEKVWGYEYLGESRTVDVHIRNLRKKIETTGRTYITTIRGVGYKFLAQ